MATIPIEVIVQDAEAPIVPSEDGTNTNITVPDTGTISSNGKTSSSASSIILPAILLVLAIGSIVAILIHKYRKQKKDKTTRKEKLAVATSSTVAILAVTVLIGNLVIPATKAATSVEPGTAELETEDKITIIATREADNDSGTITATVKDTSYATANLDFGYKVTAAMAEGATTANLYLDGDETSEHYIAPVSGGTLADNTWGYTLEEPSEESSYLSISLSTKPSTMVKGIAQTAEDTAVDIYYTVQIDKDMPNGTYTGELEYTISPAIEYMQDFSTLTSTEKTATLARMTEGKQYILKDNRDGNPYYISKLKDNNVWMTQNLDLDIDENTTYTHADTDLGWSDPVHPDLTASWKPINSTLTVEGTSVPGWSNSNTEPYSADPGNVYYYTSGNDENDKKYDSTTDCERDHNDGSCPHYHAGNYYNWSAAVASNDTSEYGDDDRYVNVETSICPAGWRLPKNRNAEGWTAGNEQDAMISSYDGIVGEIQIGGGGSYASRNYLEGGFNAIRTAPLWLARSGGVGGGSLGATGYLGYYWSSTVYYSSDSYQLNFHSDGVNTVVGSIRFGGYSVRCIAQ